MFYDFPKKMFTVVFWRLEKSTKRFVICYGGAASSKSYSIQQLFLIRLLEGTHDLLVIRKNSNTLFSSVFEGFKEVARRWDLLKKLDFVYGGDKKEIRCKLNDNKIIFKGVDDPEQLKSLKHGIRYIYIEEASQLYENDFNELNRRLRGILDIQIFLFFNPISENHWIKRKFFDELTYFSDTEVIHCTYKDNQFLTDEDRHNMETKNIGNDYNIYVLGQWGIESEGLVFLPDEWEVCDVVPEYAKRLPYGMDFGFSVDPTTLIELFLADGCLYINELFYKKGLTNISINGNEQSIQYHLELLKIPKQSLIVADSAEKKSILELRQLGYDVRPAIKGADSIIQGIDILHSYKKKITKNSVNTINEYRNYMKSVDKDRQYRNIPIDKYNHSIDSQRYVCLSRGILW